VPVSILTALWSGICTCHGMLLTLFILLKPTGAVWQCGLYCLQLVIDYRVVEVQVGKAPSCELHGPTVALLHYLRMLNSSCGPVRKRSPYVIGGAWLPLLVDG
jgi:hypothetical protein